MKEEECSLHDSKSLDNCKDDNESCNSLSTIQEDKCSSIKELPRKINSAHLLQVPLAQVSIDSCSLFGTGKVILDLF